MSFKTVILSVNYNKSLFIFFLTFVIFTTQCVQLKAESVHLIGKSNTKCSKYLQIAKSLFGPQIDKKRHLFSIKSNSNYALQILTDNECRVQKITVRPKYLWDLCKKGGDMLIVNSDKYNKLIKNINKIKNMGKIYYKSDTAPVSNNIALYTDEYENAIVFRDVFRDENTNDGESIYSTNVHFLYSIKIFYFRKLYVSVNDFTLSKDLKGQIIKSVVIGYVSVGNSYYAIRLGCHTIEVCKKQNLYLAGPLND